MRSFYASIYWSVHLSSLLGSKILLYSSCQTSVCAMGCRLRHAQCCIKPSSSAANTMHGTQIMLNKCWWSVQPWPWFYFPLGCASSHLFGHLLHSTSHCLRPPFWSNPCYGTSCAQELPGNLVPQLYSHFSNTAPSSHLSTSVNPERKGSKHPMGRPLTTLSCLRGQF